MHVCVYICTYVCVYICTHIVWYIQPYCMYKDQQVIQTSRPEQACVFTGVEVDTINEGCTL